MEDTSAKRRSWIKNIAIIFLTLMLILTLFSNTFMNMSLPQVATQYSRSGSITTQITGTGTVQAKDTYLVTAENSTKIKDVGVKVGSQVQIGDILYILEDDGSDQLIDAISKLAGYKSEYNDTLALVSPDYSAKLLEISRAKDDLAKEKAELNALNKKLAEANSVLQATDKETSEITKQKNRLDAKITATNNKITALESAGAVYNEKESPVTLLANAKKNLSELEAAIAAAELNNTRAEATKESREETLEKKEEKKADAEYALSEYQKTIGSSTASDATVLSMQRSLDQLELDLRRLIEDYEIDIQKVKQTYENDPTIIAKNNALSTYWLLMSNPAATQAQREDAYSAYLAAERAAVEAETAYQNGLNNSPLKRTIEDKERAIKLAKEDLAKEQKKLEQSSTQESTLQAYKNAVTAAETERKAAEKAVSDAEKALTAAKAELTTLTGKLPVAKSTVELYENVILLEELNAELKVIEAEAEAAEIKGSIDEEIKAKQAVITPKERNLADLELALESLRKESEKTSGIYEDKLKILDDTIKAQEKIVADLSDSERVATVTAPVAGTVTSLGYVAGQSISLGSTIAEIQITEKGCKATFSVTVEQANRIRVGDSASVQYYWGPQISSVIESIQPDSSNPQKSRIVTIAITGSVTIGTQLTFIIGQRSQNYDCVIPHSAIRTDSDGKYVLVVDAKSTPLGNRYTARKVPVQVLAEDDSNVAVSGLSYGEFMITTSSVPIESGMQVRLIES